MKPKLKGKRWSKDFEKPIYKLWKSKKLYAFDPKSKKPVYSVDTPPPYVNTPVHIGQATTYVLMDMFARFRRMTGWNVLFPLGLDRNGLPIEMAAEEKFKIKLTELPRKKALEYCESILKKASLASTKTFLRSGISFNSWRRGQGIGNVYYTDSPEYRALTQETFIDLWNKGLVYEDSSITNYCPGCQTTIADAEIEYADLPTTFNNIIFKVRETGEKIVIGTTRPELICTCGMVIFNPDDQRYQHLEGMTAITPVFKKKVPIRAHPMADIEKGTGLVMMCSAGDLSDIRFFREMKLKPVIAINRDGTMNENAGFLKGMKIEEARKRMTETLHEKNLLVKQTKTRHRTPVCERSKDQIEFIAMPEFYLKQLEYKPKMKLFANRINFFAPRSRQIMLDWIDSLSTDWPISRRRFYATEIPLWYCKKCNEPVLPPKGKYYRPWKEKPPKKALKQGKCYKCGSRDFRGETRVFDTWFDSSITPLYILKYSRDDGFFKKNAPCVLRPQGKEIIRTWLYYTVLKDYLLTNKLIFRDVWINYHIVDEKGRKMSKSLGNVIDPKDVLDRFGAEPFRLWAAIEGNLEKKDFRCSFERIQGVEKTLTKLWNIARFISMFTESKKPKKLQSLDEWILYETSRLAEYSRKHYERYDFHNPSVRIKHFIWETFASHYIELVKNRAYNQEGRFNLEEQESALYTLHHCLNILLKILAPVTPFIAYRIYKGLRKKDIHSEEFPKPEKITKPGFSTDALISLNSRIWKEKKDKKLSLKAKLKSLTLPIAFKPIERDLVEAHGVQNLKYGKSVTVSV
jgi:valyl-tRNA synthetase